MYETIKDYLQLNFGKEVELGLLSRRAVSGKVEGIDNEAVLLSTGTLVPYSAIEYICPLDFHDGM